MKKKFLFLSSTVFVFSVTALFYLSSCQKESTNKEIKINKASPKLAGVAGGNCKTLCFLDPSSCIGSSGICLGGPKICLNLCVEVPLPVCMVDGCGPWEHKFKDPIIRLIDLFKLDPEPQPNLGVIFVGVTPNIAWLQLYAPIGKVLTKEGLTLDKAITLDENFAKQQGLSGNTIPAGKYPVVYDINTKTYNAIVSVK